MAKKKDESEEFGADVEMESAEKVALAEKVAATDIHVELTEKEKLELEAEAREEVAAAIKASKKKDFKAAAKKRLQAEAMFRNGKDDSGEDLDEVYLELASHPRYIVLDGAVFHSGRKYRKRRSVIQVLKEQMARGWRQEAARLGEKEQNLTNVRSVMPSDPGLRYN